MVQYEVIGFLKTLTPLHIGCKKNDSEDRRFPRTPKGEPVFPGHVFETQIKTVAERFGPKYMDHLKTLSIPNIRVRRTIFQEDIEVFNGALLFSMFLEGEPEDLGILLSSFAALPFMGSNNSNGYGECKKHLCSIGCDGTEVEELSQYVYGLNPNFKSFFRFCDHFEKRSTPTPNLCNDDSLKIIENWEYWRRSYLEFGEIEHHFVSGTFRNFRNEVLDGPGLRNELKKALSKYLEFDRHETCNPPCMYHDLVGYQGVKGRISPFVHQNRTFTLVVEAPNYLFNEFYTSLSFLKIPHKITSHLTYTAEDYLGSNQKLIKKQVPASITRTAP